MQLITKNIRWQGPVEIYKIAEFEHSFWALSWDIVLTEWCPEQTKKKNIN